MEKSDKAAIYEEAAAKTSNEKKNIFFLNVSVILLSVTCVFVIAFGAVLVHNLDNDKVTTCHDDNDAKSDEVPHLASPREFYIGIPRQEFTQTFHVHQTVYVDEHAQTEAILFKDPEWKHMQDMVFVDHEQGFQIAYSSETAECLFAPHIAKTHEENLQFLWMYDGTNQTAPTIRHEYIYGDKVNSMNAIPEEMRAFCTLSNSYWLVNADHHEWDADQIYHVCICSYFECICTRCAQADCWGRCCDGHVEELAAM